MNILLISGSFPPMKCGVGDYTAKLAETLAMNDDVVVAVLTDASIDQRTGNTPYKVIASIESWTVRDTFRVINEVEKISPDIVHIQYPTQAYGRKLFPWLIPMILHFKGFRVVQTWHEHYPVGNWRAYFIGWVPGGIIAVRPNYMDRMPPWFRRIISNKQFRFIPNASSIPAVKISPEKRRIIRDEFGANHCRLIVYYGFVFPTKGIESIFKICDPEHNRIVLVCDLDSGVPYHRSIKALVDNSLWKGKAFVTGFLPAIDVANILASADAVVLPFTTGGGIWNTSIHGVRAQGTFLLTTSKQMSGYSVDENTYYAKPRDTADMKNALDKYIGVRSENSPSDQFASWESIATAHIGLYKTVLENTLKARRNA
jgi:glycosyltransferase involved in cell wall biosynthesis